MLTTILMAKVNDVIIAKTIKMIRRRIILRKRKKKTGDHVQRKKKWQEKHNGEASDEDVGRVVGHDDLPPTPYRCSNQIFQSA